MPFNCFKMCLYGVYAVLLVAMTADMTAGKTELEIKRFTKADGLQWLG